jgi:hypothetical protein
VLCACIGAPCTVSADTGLEERLRAQGIYAHQTRQTPRDDFAGQVSPELTLFSIAERAQFRLTYTFLATAHTAYPADISNRANLVATLELSKRTTMLLSAEVGHSTVANALIARPASETTVGVVPITAGQLLTTRISEATSWEASPVVRLGQQVDASYVVSIDAPLALETYLANAVVSLDREWKRDALGIDFRASYVRSHAEPLPPQRLVPLALTPHWRHDISRSLTSLLLGGASVIVSPDTGTRARLAPFLQGSLLYTVDDASFELLGSVGTQPNALTAQLLYADQVTLRASTPLSVEHGVVASAAVGYTHGSIVNVNRGASRAPDFDSFIADASVGWSPVDALQLFARYLFIDQITADTPPTITPAVQRSTVILGIQLSSRPDPVRVPTRFPQRVDRTDTAPR